MSTLKVDSIANVAGTVNKGILQVVTASVATLVTTSSSSFADLTGLACTITPRASSSKILVFFSFVPTGPSGTYGHYNVERAISGGATSNIFMGDADSNRTRCIGSQYFHSSMNNYYSGQNYAFIGVDSPSTTSAVTYQIQASSSTGAVGVNRDAYNDDRAEDPVTTSHITVMEIQG